MDSLLKSRIEKLEEDLLPTPPRIMVHHDLPFAIFIYPPNQEYELRKELRLLGQRLENTGKKIRFISLSDLMWDTLDKSKGINYIIDTERKVGFNKAQETVNQILTTLLPLPEELAKKINGCDQERTIIFLTGASSLAPNAYRMSTLLKEMKGKTQVPIMLFYPGSISAGGLKFMDIGDKQNISPYGYHVKIYS